MIRSEVINEDEDHIIVRSDEPVRIEMSVVNGRTIVHVYRGVKDHSEQEPVGGYMGTDGPNNSWEHNNGTTRSIE